MLSLSDGMFSGVRENSLTLMIRKEVVILDDDTLVTSVFSGRTRIDAVVDCTVDML